jgi:hypothetical protein
LGINDREEDESLDDKRDVVDAADETVEKADAHGAEMEEIEMLSPDEGEHGSRRRRRCPFAGSWR